LAQAVLLEISDQIDSFSSYSSLQSSSIRLRVQPAVTQQKMGSGVSTKSEIKDHLEGVSHEELAGKLANHEISVSALEALEIAISKEKKRQQKTSAPATNPLVERLGGRAALDELNSVSNKIMRAVHLSARQDDYDAQQDIIYQGTGIKKLISDAEATKKLFDELCNVIIEKCFATNKVKCELLAGSVKSFARGDVKVQVGYNGKTTYLKDVVRGTLKVISEPTPQLLRQVYDSLSVMVEEVGTMIPGAAAFFVKFKDRYQKPAGQYMDWQFFVSLNNYICELQVNFREAVEKKRKRGPQDI